MFHFEERKLPVPKYLGEVLRPGFDVVVISAGHSEYKTRKFISFNNIRPKVIFDAIGLLSNDDK